MDHVYHWKHGWIPLDHIAALSKAKGNHKAAARMLHDVASGKHTLTRDQHAQAIRSLEQIQSPADRAAALKNALAAADHAGHGDVVPASLRRGGNRERIRADMRTAQTAQQSRAEAHAKGYKSETAGFYGSAKHAQADHTENRLTSTQADREAAAQAAHDREQARQYAERKKAGQIATDLEHLDGVHTPDAQAASHAALEARTLASVRAKKMSPADVDATLQAAMRLPESPQQQALVSALATHLTELKAKAETPASKAVHIDHSGDGTLLTLDRTDLASREAAKAAGFKWSSNLGSWYLPRNWSESTRRSKVEQLTAKVGAGNVHVEDGGIGKTTTAAEREAAKISSAHDRAARMSDVASRKDAEAETRLARAREIGSHIPFGQPILVGHHSEGRHRSDVAKINASYDKGFAAMNEADAARRATATAEQTAKGDDPLKRQRRIDKNEAEIRRLDKILSLGETAAKVDPNSALGERLRNSGAVLQPAARARLTAQRAELADTVAHDKAQIAASGHKAISAAAIKPGDVVEYRGRKHVVAKVNKTTVSVPTGYSWHDKVPINQITKHHPKPAA